MRSYFILLLSVFLLQGCRQKALPIDLLAEPVFYLSGKIGADSIDLKAGSNGYTNSFATSQDANGTKVFSGSFIKETNSAATKISFNVRNNSNGNNATINTLFNVTDYYNYVPAISNNYGKIELVIIHKGKTYKSHHESSTLSTKIFTLTKVTDYKEGSATKNFARVQGDVATWIYTNSTDSLLFKANGISVAIPLD
jgi:hypothetical protein